MFERGMRAGVGPAILDTSTFADLYRSYTAAVFNYCLFRVNDRAVAEDLAADTFERAWKARYRYRPERAAFCTWLFIIARRVVIDWQRRQARRSLFRFWEPPAGTLPSPEVQVEETEQQRRLRRLVAALTPAEQELIALKFGAGMTNREIGPVIGKSETAVGTMLYRLMKKLRTSWNEAE